MNINLNAGGIIGAILGGGGALLYGALAFTGGNSNATSAQIDDASSYAARAFLFAVIAGALIGTTLWSVAFGQRKQP